MTFKIEINSVDVSEYVTSKRLEVPIQDNNRNVEPIASGFVINVSNAYSGTISPGHKVEFFIDGVAKFRGFVNSSENNNRYLYRVVTVYHILRFLETKKVDYQTLHSLLNNTADFTGSEKTISSVDTGTDYLTSVGHGYSNLQGVQFKSTGSLPSPLVENTYYFIKNKTTDTFQVSPEQSVGSSAIDITSVGSGTITCDLSKPELYNPKDVDGYPNTSVFWVITKMFELAGMTIDSSAVDSTVIYTASAVGYTWKTLIFDENMLYSLNQSVASYFNIITDSELAKTYLQNKVTCWELLQLLLGKLNFRISYTGTDEFTITNWTNSVYSITSGDRLEYSTYTDTGKGSTAYGAEAFNDDRLNYSADSSTGSTAPIEDGYQLNGTDGNFNEIVWWSNLKIFLRLSTADIVITSKTPVNYWRIDQASTNSINAIEDDWDVEEITAPIQASNVNVLKEIIVVDNSRQKSIQQSEIVQEDKV
jgi:hypothetical protein